VRRGGPLHVLVEFFGNSGSSADAILVNKLKKVVKVIIVVDEFFKGESRGCGGGGVWCLRACEHVLSVGIWRVAPLAFPAVEASLM